MPIPIAPTITIVKSRYLILALVALLAVVTIQLRPIGVAVFHVRPAPADITIVGTADGGHICEVTSDCQTVTPTHIGMNVDHILPLFFGAPAILLLLLAATSMRATLFFSLLKPPPQSPSYA